MESGGNYCNEEGQYTASSQALGKRPSFSDYPVRKKILAQEPPLSKNVSQQELERTLLLANLEQAEVEKLKLEADLERIEIHKTKLEAEKDLIGRQKVLVNLQIRRIQKDLFLSLERYLFWDFYLETPTRHTIRERSLYLLPRRSWSDLCPHFYTNINSTVANPRRGR